MAHAGNSFVGRFRTLLFSNTAYIGGLMLLWLFNPYDVKWLVVVILVLLAIGTSGANLLQDVLKDLVNDVDESPDKNKKRSLARAKIWSRIASVTGAISAILWVSPDAVGGVHLSYEDTFLICMIIMIVTSIIFCKGHHVYHQGELTERPVEILFRVFHARIQMLLKCNSRRLTSYSRKDRSPRHFEIEMTENEGTTKERSPQPLDNKRSICYKEEDMVVVKSLLKMFPMWGMYCVVSLILATGSTFFLQQYNNLNTNKKIAIQMYNLVQDFSSFAVPFLYHWICGRFHENEKLKMGVGLLFSIISCVFAWQLEVHRLEKVNHLVDENDNTSISFLWLVPQFCMLGCMKGLTWEGLSEFYKSQIKDEPIRSYGDEYIEIVKGLGKLTNIFLILIFESRVGWFNDTINDSRLDKYYVFLICVCTTNFIIYCWIATCFYQDTEQHQDKTIDDSRQDHSQLSNNNDSQQDL